MDSNAIFALIPIMALAIGLAAVLRMPREAFLPKQKKGEVADRARLDELELQVQDLRDALAETQERLDFAERAMLGQAQRPAIEPERTPPFITPVG